MGSWGVWEADLFVLGGWDLYAKGGWVLIGLVVLVLVLRKVV